MQNQDKVSSHSRKRRVIQIGHICEIMIGATLLAEIVQLLSTVVFTADEDFYLDAIYRWDTFAYLFSSGLFPFLHVGLIVWTFLLFRFYRREGESKLHPVIAALLMIPGINLIGYAIVFRSIGKRNRYQGRKMILTESSKIRPLLFFLYAFYLPSLFFLDMFTFEEIYNPNLLIYYFLFRMGYYFVLLTFILINHRIIEVLPKVGIDYVLN